ncbi:MAG: hypothetical protein JSS49_29220 [Planctomycetes bacterium]|nr:hypothetical protein [Planctomycetota bacterium]
MSATGWKAIYGLTSDQSALFTGSLLLMFGTVLMALACREAWRWKLPAVAIAVQFLLIPGLIGLLCRWRDTPGLTSLLTTVLHSLGQQAVVTDDNTLLVHFGENGIEFLPSPARMEVFITALMVCGWGSLAIFAPLRDRSPLLKALAVTLAYILVRLVLLIVFRSEMPPDGLETSIWFGLATMLPIVVFLPRHLEIHEIEPIRWNLLLQRLGMAFLLGGSWAVLMGWEDPGTVKQSRILFDDSHGEWEPTNTEFGPESFSQVASYSYGSMYELLSWHYPIRRHREGALTREALQDIDVLIVKTPTQALKIEEIDAIQQFVADGGGLFLIGDHTNLFGMTTYINPLATRFGILFRNDDTFSLSTEGPSIWRRHCWPDHPIAQAVGSFDFETSCTLQAPFWARAPIVGYGLGSEPGNYSRPGFFGNIHLDPGEDFGFFIQYATTSFGHGRVAAFSDSTTFSNFSLYFPGRREMVLASIEYLNRKNTILVNLPKVAAAFAFALCLLMAMNWPGVAPAASLLAVILGFGISGSFVNAQCRLSLPPAPESIRRIVFDNRYSRLEMPTALTLEDQMPHTAFDTFLVASQRMSLLPSVSSTALDDVRAGDVIVLTHLERPLAAKDKERLHQFLNAGGRLLVMDGMLHPGGATNSLLNEFGIQLSLTPRRSHARVVAPDEEPDTHESKPATPKKAEPATAGDGKRQLHAVSEPGKHGDVVKQADPTSTNDNPHDHAAPPLRDSVYGFTGLGLSVDGVLPVLFDPDGRVLFGVRDYGQGRIGVFAESASLAKSALGQRFQGEPNPAQREAHYTAYLILSKLLDDKDWQPENKSEEGIPHTRQEHEQR